MNYCVAVCLFLLVCVFVCGVFVYLKLCVACVCDVLCEMLCGSFLCVRSCLLVSAIVV